MFRRLLHWLRKPYTGHLEYGDVIEAETWQRPDGTWTGKLIVNGKERLDIPFNPTGPLPKGPLIRL
jgi:hypothetical protein